jgi:hypothetical protein
MRSWDGLMIVWDVGVGKVRTYSVALRCESNGLVCAFETDIFVEC